MDFACSGLLLDADGTLVDSTAAVERTWRRWAAAHGLDGNTVVRLGSGRPTEDTVAEFLPPGQRERAVALIDELELNDLDGVRAIPGAADLLGALGSWPWAIVTSCSPSLLQARAGAAGLPDPPVLVTAGDVAAGKPDPEGYVHAAEKLGLDPDDCVVIEDAPAGVRAGKDAGATVIAVTTTATEGDLHEADAVVGSLASLSIEPLTEALVVHADTTAP